MPLRFATRLDNVETSAIRELFKLLGKPGIISFAGGFPDSAMFDIDGLKQAADDALTHEAGGALQYGATEGYEPLRSQLAEFMHLKGVSGLEASQLIVTTGSQPAHRRYTCHACAAAVAGVSPVSATKACTKVAPPATRSTIAPGTAEPCRWRRSHTSAAASR